MISVSQAHASIDQHVGPLSAETVPLYRAHGRVLREPVASPEDLPPFDRSAMDGYAVRHDEPGKELDVVAEVRAGQVVNRELQFGEAIRIFTGAQLPGKNLRVIMQEHIEAEGARIRIVKSSGGSNVRLRGEDARAGEVLLQPGIVLDATAMGLLASVGKTAVLVSKRPRVLHLTTGDEIVSPEHTPGPGQIRNSNASLIASLCREQGVADVTQIHSVDDLKVMIGLLSQARPESHDLILISGGSGPGVYDFSAEVFRHLNAAIHFREVNVRPGKPLIFGAASPQIMFGLPGNVLSHFVCFHLFVRRALDLLAARPVATPQTGLLAEPLKDALNGRETWWPARAKLREGRLECRPLPWKSSGDITRLPGATALVKVPASTPQLPAGTIIELLLTGRIS
jgi:molybdopterin molybdotransferase